MRTVSLIFGLFATSVFACDYNQFHALQSGYVQQFAVQQYAVPAAPIVIQQYAVPVQSFVQHHNAQPLRFRDQQFAAPPSNGHHKIGQFRQSFRATQRFRAPRQIVVERFVQPQHSGQNVGLLRRAGQIVFGN